MSTTSKIFKISPFSLQTEAFFDVFHDILNSNPQKHFFFKTSVFIIFSKAISLRNIVVNLKFVSINSESRCG